METNVKMGEVVTFTCGEYSDYSLCGSVVFTKDCDLVMMRDQFKELLKQQEMLDYWEHGMFVTFLVSQGYCLPLDTREMHLGSYSKLLSETISNW